MVPNDDQIGGRVRVYAVMKAVGSKGMDIDGEAEDDYSGRSVSLSADGSIVAIGAYNDGNGTGSGHVAYTCGMEAVGSKGVDIDGEAEDNYSGYSVSLSDDGSVVAIGAIDNV